MAVGGQRRGGVEANASVVERPAGIQVAQADLVAAAGWRPPVAELQHARRVAPGTLVGLL